jgi:hypothetical protein
MDRMKKEDAMRKIILCAAALVVSAGPLFGQAPAGPTAPRFDLGGSGAVVIPPHGETAMGLIETRFGARLTRRFGVEVSVGLFPAALSIDHLDGAYTIQGCYRLRPVDGRRTTIFATFGGSGGFSRHRSREFRYTLSDGTERVYPSRTSSSVSLPIVPTVGVGFQRDVGAHLAVRADVQAVVCPYFDRVGVLVSGGVSIPLGSARH